MNNYFAFKHHHIDNIRDLSNCLLWEDLIEFIKSLVIRLLYFIYFLELDF